MTTETQAGVAIRGGWVPRSGGRLWENKDALARCVNTKRGLTEPSLEGPG